MKVLLEKLVDGFLVMLIALIILPIIGFLLVLTGKLFLLGGSLALDLF